MVAVRLALLVSQSAPMPPGTQWLIIGGAGLLVLYVLMRPRKKKDPLEPGAPRMSLAQQKAVERQMESLLVEFSNMARQMSAQLDTRAAKLELLIRDADERLAALRAAGALAAAQPAATSRAETSEAQSVAAPAPLGAARSDARHADIYALADQGNSAMEIARNLGRPSGEVELILALRPKEQEWKPE